MFGNKDYLKKMLWWEPKSGTSSIWFENQTNLGPLFKHHSEVYTCHQMSDIDVFLNKDGWNYKEMINYAPKNIVKQVKDTMGQCKLVNQEDQPWWTPIGTGLFNVKSSQEMLKQREDFNNNLKKLWCNNSSFWLGEFGKEKYLFHR